MSSLIEDRSYAYALQIVRLCQYLTNALNERVLSRQLLRSGTAVGALMHEAKFAQSKADFINKASIALKEANESQYWLRLLHDSGYLNDETFNPAYTESREITSILVAIVKNSKANITKSEKANDEKGSSSN